MSGGAYHDEAENFAATLFVQAAWPVVLVVAALLAAPLLPGNPLSILPRPAAILVAVAAGFATFALSALLVFDAMLFRLMASHPDEKSGGAAVDDMLERMRLKPAPKTPRTLAERIAGTRRILAFQRTALAVFVAAHALQIVGR